MPLPVQTSSVFWASMLMLISVGGCCHAGSVACSMFLPELLLTLLQLAEGHRGGAASRGGGRCPRTTRNRNACTRGCAGDMRGLSALVRQRLFQI